MSDRYDVAVIGGGQAGLAVGYHLSRAGFRFVIADAGTEIGEQWRRRWDSLVLFTSARYSGLPGMPFPGPAGTYPGKDQVADYLRSYAEAFALPVRLGTRVEDLTPNGAGFTARTGEGEIHAARMVIAAGPFQEPFIPRVAEGLAPEVVQVHSSAYRNPAQLPAGRIVVVGGGNSGYQIAEELAASRSVVLAVGTGAPHLPQRLLGRDVFWWLDKAGVYRASLDSLVGRRIHARPDPVIGTSDRRLRRMGVSFRPRLTGAEGRRIVFADDTEVEADAVVWATGYRTDHSWVRVPGALDERGRILHRRGVTPVRGLYVVGLSWLHTRGSALIGWVGDDAEFLVRHMSEGDETPAVGLSRPGHA